MTRRDVIKDKKHYFKVWDLWIDYKILDIKVHKKDNKTYYVKTKLE
jgi:hypothetical protein